MASPVGTSISVRSPERKRPANISQIKLPSAIPAADAVTWMQDQLPLLDAIIDGVIDEAKTDPLSAAVVRPVSRPEHARVFVALHEGMNGVAEGGDRG